ncbi:uncharacterized membrane-anchored protein [Sanguibacter keddieii DSM 10542]|uniref:Uncharacterized membrane-anchored protein n=1 Tax=Sanguibacter keddieii (strain ATCC 51767 / DSM 10542 / NCFB 3025 / ST-74) TaxID=446469 RepID=D1BIF4_SANKS|nr:putative cytokinetic ring protein SteA [Sanguibacter keddieii]ACZ22131.1 uncharacterized membrane-anchored protein [Sanguibacter keddieii DSM 10542]
MKLRRRSTAKDAAHPLQGVTGTAKVDRRTKDLTKRLRPGDIAVIDHLDIDRVAAEALVAAQPSAVLNAAKSISGRYPNLGPSILVEAGVVLVDDLGADVMSVREGKTLRIDDGAVYLGDTLVTEGVVQDVESVTRDLEEAREGLSAQLESFAANTMDYLRRERDLLLDGVGIPEISTKIAGRQVLIVVRGYHYREDLKTLRSYIKEFRPILIGVDGGADAIIEAGWSPDLIVGDMDSVSDKALRCGAEVVVHAYRDGRAPGLERVEALAVPFVVFPAAGTSEDIAMLLADDMGAEVIVAVGTHATLVEFLDKGRAGMASTFLTRLRVGGKLVDAKGVSRLYRHRISTAQLILLAVAGIAAVVAAMVSTSVGQTFLGLTGARIDDLWSWVVSLAWWT